MYILVRKKKVPVILEKISNFLFNNFKGDDRFKAVLSVLIVSCQIRKEVLLATHLRDISPHLQEGKSKAKQLLHRISHGGSK